MYSAATTTSNETFHAVDADTGKIVWTQAVQGTPSRPTLAGDTVLVSSGVAGRANWVRACVWHAPPTRCMHSTARAHTHAHTHARITHIHAQTSTHTGTPIHARTRTHTRARGRWSLAITCKASTDLKAFDALTGSPLWTAANYANQWLTPTVDGGLVYVSA